MPQAKNISNLIDLDFSKLEQKILPRFLRYVKVDTQSNEESKTYPSTAKQLKLLRLLEKELKALGIKNTKMDKYGYVMATIPSNLSKSATKKVPAVGFVAHVDTAPNISGKNVKPQVIKNYRGGNIKLPGNKKLVITAKENPALKRNIGNTIVTSDGTTLLGADNKAGVAIIMSLAETIMKNPSVKHGDIKIGFTPDEEIGSGTKYFDIKKFGAKVAYTIDGELAPKLNRETFSADSALLTVYGKDIHPALAKDIMVNASRVAGDILSRLPKQIAPETTDGRKPYIHPYMIQGDVAKATIKLLFRDFETAGLKKLKRCLEKIIADVQKIHPKAKIELKINETYRNMGDYLGENPKVVSNLDLATKKSGLKPMWQPIRGGTDGSFLTAKGLPTPNIFSGSTNHHGATEWVSLYEMRKSLEVVLNLITIYSNSK